MVDGRTDRRLVKANPMSAPAPATLACSYSGWVERTARDVEAIGLVMNRDDLGTLSSEGGRRRMEEAPFAMRGQRAESVLLAQLERTR